MNNNRRHRRILLVSPMPPAMGGISVSSARLRDRLLADGYEVDTYNLQRIVSPAFHTIWQFLNTLYIPFYILFHKKYDIIHFHISSYWRRVYLKLVLPLFKGAKTVVTIHGDVAYYTSRPFSSSVLDAGDRIICVRSGNRELLPSKLQNRTVEIPAFIMPSMEEINKINLPQNVKSFIDIVDSKKMPLIVFNGALVLGKPYYDLYGFEDMVKLSDHLINNGIEAAMMVIVNDQTLDEEKVKFLKRIERRLAVNNNVMVVKSKHFSLLPIFASERVIYVRPTKTDGDSLSVREALALGTPVVATSNTPRPEGTISYDPNLGYRGLFKATEKAIGMLADKKVHLNCEYKDFYNKITDVYTSLLKKDT